MNRLYGDGATERLAQAHVCVVGVGGVGSPLLRNAVAGLGCARRRSVVDDRYIYNDFYNRPAAKDEIADATGKYWKGSGE